MRLKRSPSPLQELRELGKFLAEQRTRAGLTQRDVARRLGYTTPQFVSNWERGVALPPLSDLPLITSLYNLQPEEVIDRVVELQRASYEDQLNELRRMLQAG